MHLAPVESAPLGNRREERILAEFVGVTVRGDSILLILFQDAGRLSELEIAPFENFQSKSLEANFLKVDSLMLN